MKTFWISVLILFAIFLTLYISQATGYYDFQQYKKVELTSDKIKQFEEDVKAGKDVKVENYLDYVKYDYNNNASRIGLKISRTIKTYVKTGIDGALSFFGVLLGG